MREFPQLKKSRPKREKNPRKQHKAKHRHAPDYIIVDKCNDLQKYPPLSIDMRTRFFYNVSKKINGRNVFVRPFFSLFHARLKLRRKKRDQTSLLNHAFLCLFVFPLRSRALTVADRFGKLLFLFGNGLCRFLKRYGNSPRLRRFL